MKCFAAGIWLLLIFSFNWHTKSVQANDFSSFLSANASLAVVVDHEYMRQRGENILANFQKILSDIIRENLRNGGINVKYFTWNEARLKKDFLAAMTVTDCESTWKFFEATQKTSILLIAITDGDCPRLPTSKALMIPMVGRGEEYPQMVFDTKMQKVLKWKSAVLLLDEVLLNENDILVKSVVHESTKQETTSIPLMLYSINDTLRSQRKRASLRKMLEPFAQDPKERKQFIVFSKFHEDVIEMAESLGMFHIYNQWLFFILEQRHGEFDAMAVTQNLNEGSNIAFITNATESACQDTLNCTIAEISMAFVTSISRIIMEEQSIYGEISDEEWEAIRLTKQEKQHEILSYMKDYLRDNNKCSTCAKWRLETAITWGRSQEYKRYKEPSVYGDPKNKNFQFIDVGYWTPLLGFIVHDALFPHIEHNFRNITMEILVAHNPPWQIIKRDTKGKIIAHEGVSMELLKELSRILNFSYVLNEPQITDDDELANLNETETLLGTLTFLIPSHVTELLQGSRFLLAAVASTVDDVNKKTYNFTTPISVQKYSFISRRPDEISRIYLFTAPFTLETWACLAAAVLITAPILYIVNKLLPLPHLQTDGLCTVKNCFWYIYGALLQQGGMYLPKADSGRLVIGVWWIVVIVLVTTYCGNLVAFLTFPKFEPGYDYFFQLFQRERVTHLGLRNGTYFEKYASISTRKDFRKFMDLAIIYNNAHTEGIDAIEQGKRINVDLRINLQLIIQRQFEKDKQCKFVLAKEHFVDEQIGLLMPSRSPYLHLINEKIILMHQMGFIERWHQMNLPTMDKCSASGIMRQVTNHKVNLDDMQGCFLVLLFGFIIALFIILIEFWYHRLYVVEKVKKNKTFST